MRSYHGQTNRATALDDLPDQRIAECLSLMHFIRHVTAAGRPWHFVSGTYTYDVARDLANAGCINLIHAGGRDYDMAEFFRAEPAGKGATR